MSVSLTRKEFYKLLWKEPQTALAKQFGVSDSAIGKAARKAEIPRPGPGYWQKLKANKMVARVPLPLRFPGASNWLHFGSKWQSEPVTVDKDKMPQEPTYDESLEDVRERVVKLVGKVAYPTVGKSIHTITKKLLDQDEERRREMEEGGYTWNKPKFDTQIDKRRLRIINAIFLKMQLLGCHPYMSTGKYEDYKEASVQVGNQHIGIHLETIEHPPRGRHKVMKKPCIKLTVKGGGRSDREEMVWQDEEGARLESHLTDIVIELLMAGEQQYRDSIQWHYEWDVRSREEHLERERLQRIEEERLFKEQREKEEKERIDNLLFQADSIQKATIIREYVSLILNRTNEIERPVDDIKEWAEWALEQANRIDPIKNLHFLNNLS